MIWAVVFLVVVGVGVALQIKAAGKTAEVLKRAKADNEALKDAAKPVTDAERERVARLFQRP